MYWTYSELVATKRSEKISATFQDTANFICHRVAPPQCIANTFRRCFLCQPKLASIATEGILNMSFIEQVNKVKKPLGTALFLPIILIISGFITTSGPAYQRQSGILGGPSASAAEPAYSGDKTAILESIPFPAFQGDIQPIPGDNMEEGVMETALFFGNGHGTRLRFLSGPFFLLVLLF